MDAQLVMWVIGGAVGVIVWLVRLEGRVNGHDQSIASVRDHTRDAITDLRDDVAYIRERIDRAIGSH